MATPEKRRTPDQVISHLTRQAARLAAHREWMEWGIERLEEGKRHMTPTGNVLLAFNEAELREIKLALDDAILCLEARIEEVGRGAGG